MTAPGNCQRAACGLPLIVVKIGERLHLLHVHESSDGCQVRRPDGRNGCRKPVPLHGAP